MAADPQTKMEALYRDVLGESHELVQRLHESAVLFQQSIEQLEAAQQETRRLVAEAGPDLRRQCEAAMRDSTSSVQQTVRDAVAAAHSLQHSIFHLWHRALLLSGVAGVAGGLLGSFALYLTW